MDYRKRRKRCSSTRKNGDNYSEPEGFFVSIGPPHLLRVALQAGNRQIESAYDGLEGLRSIEAVAYDLVMTDVNMPGLVGFRLNTGIFSNDVHAVAEPNYRSGGWRSRNMRLVTPGDSGELAATTAARI